jgi:hypothetical protein
MIIKYVLYKKPKTKNKDLTLLYNIPKIQNKKIKGSKNDFIQNYNRKNQTILHLCSLITENFLKNMSCSSHLPQTSRPQRGTKAKFQSYTTKALILNKKQNPPFFNFTFDKGRLKNLVSWTLENYGQYKTVELLEQLKKTGFEYATKAGISLGIDDLKIPPKKNTLLLEAEQLTKLTVHQYQRADITAVERFQRLIETWHRTSEQLKQEVINYFEETDILNPVYMMAFSGARGNISQVRQLVGMRGLMSDPQGQIIDFPIRSNFREGLTLTEYIISSYGARKGIVDTALRTANAGYLTRRLVDVAQHVIISHYDCGTHKGIFLTDMKEGNKIIVSVHNRIIGRVLARDIYKLNTNSKIASRNQEISTDLAFEITKITNRIFVRSALTCNTTKLLCQLCYGWSLAQGNLVSVGEAVGVIAAQSIGEPGTQLTMRTFHTGGVFSGDVSDEIRAPYNGFVYYENSIPGILIRALDGKILFLTKSDGTLLFSTNRIVDSNKNPVQTEWFHPLKTGKHIYTNSDFKKYKIPAYTVLFIRNGEFIFQKQVIAQITSIRTKSNMRDIAELVIKSELEGLFYAKNLNMQKKVIGPKPKFVGEAKQKLLIDTKAMEIVIKARGWNFAWVLSGKRYELPLLLKSFPSIGDYITPQTVITRYNLKLPNYYKLKLNITNKICTTDLRPKGRTNKQIDTTIDTTITTKNNLFFSLDTKAKNFRLCGDISQSILKFKKIKLFNLFTKYTKKTKYSLESSFYLRKKSKNNLVFNFFNNNYIPTIESTKIGKYVYNQKLKKCIKTKKTHNIVENYITCNYRNLISKQQNIKVTPKISSLEKQLMFNKIALRPLMGNQRGLQTTMQKINLKQDLLFLNLKKIKYYKIGYFHFFNSQNSINIFGKNILFLQRVMNLQNGHKKNKNIHSNSIIYQNQNNKNLFDQKQNVLKNDKSIKFNYNVNYNEVMLTPTSLNSKANLKKTIVFKRIKSSNYLFEWFSSKSIIDPKAFYYSNNFLFSKASFVKTLETLLKKKQEFTINNRQQALQRRRDWQLTQQINTFEQTKNLNYAMSQNIKLILAENLLNIYKKIYKKFKKNFIQGIRSEAINSLSSPFFPLWGTRTEGKRFIPLKYIKEKNMLYDKQQTSLQTLIFKKWFKDSNILSTKQQKQSPFQLKMKIDCFINNLTKNIYYFNKTLDSVVQKGKQQIKSINTFLHPYYYRNRFIRHKKGYFVLKKVGSISSNIFFNKKKIKSYNEKSFFTANKHMLTFYNKKTQIKKYFMFVPKGENTKISNNITNIQKFSTLKNRSINKTFIFEYLKLAQKKYGTKQILKHFKSVNLKKKNHKKKLGSNKRYLTKKNLELLTTSQTKNDFYTQGHHLNFTSQKKKTNIQKQNLQKSKHVHLWASLTHIFYTSLHKNKQIILKKLFQQKIKIKKVQILNKNFKITNKHINYICPQKNALILLLLTFIKTLFVSYNYISPNYIKKVHKQKKYKPQLQNSFASLEGTTSLVSPVITYLNQTPTSVQSQLLPNIRLGNFTIVNKRIKKALRPQGGTQQILFVKKKISNSNVFSFGETRVILQKQQHRSVQMLKAFSAKEVYNTINLINEITHKTGSSGIPNFLKGFNITTTWVYKISSVRPLSSPFFPLWGTRTAGKGNQRGQKLTKIFNNFLFPGHFILNNILFDKNKIIFSLNDKKLKHNKRNEITKTKYACLSKGITNKILFNTHKQYNTKKISNQTLILLKTKTFFYKLQQLGRILNLEKYKKDLIWIQNKKPRFLPKEFFIKSPEDKQNINFLDIKKISNNFSTQHIMANGMQISKNIANSHPFKRMGTTSRTANLVNLNDNKTIDSNDKTNKRILQKHKIDTNTVNLLSYFIQFINKKNSLTLKDFKNIKKEYEKVKTKNLFLSPSLSTKYLFFTQVYEINASMLNSSQKPRLPFNINKETLKDPEKIFSNIKNKTFINLSETYYKNYKINILNRALTNIKESNTKNNYNSYPMKSINYLNKNFYNKFIKLEKNIKNNNSLVNKYWNIILDACTVKVYNPSNKSFLTLDVLFSCPQRGTERTTVKNPKLFITLPSLSNFIKSMKIQRKLTTNINASTLLELVKNYYNFITKARIIKQPIFCVNKNYKNKLFIISQKKYQTNKNKKFKISAFPSVLVPQRGKKGDDNVFVPLWGTKADVRFFDRYIYLTKNLFVNRDELINKKHKQKKDIHLFAKKPNFALIINTYNINKISKHKEEKNQNHKQKHKTNDFLVFPSFKKDVPLRGTNKGDHRGHTRKLVNFVSIPLWKRFIKNGELIHKKYSHKNKFYGKTLISYAKPLFFDLYFNNPSYCFTYTAKIQKEKTFVSIFKKDAKKLYYIPKQPCLNICFYLKYSSDLNPKIFKTNLESNLTQFKKQSNRLNMSYHTKRSFSSPRGTTFFSNLYDYGAQLKSGISFNYLKDNIVTQRNYFSPFEGELIYTKMYKNYLDLNPYENLKTGLMYLNNFTHLKTKEEKMRMAMFKYYLKTINKLPNQKKRRQKAWSRFNLILTKKDLMTLNYDQNFLPHKGTKTKSVFSSPYGEEIQKNNPTQRSLRFNIQHFSNLKNVVKTKYNTVYNTIETEVMQSKSVFTNNSKSLLNTVNYHKNKVIYLQAYVNKLLQASIKNNLKVQTIAELNKKNIFNKTYDFNLKNKWLKQNFSYSLNKFISFKQHSLVDNIHKPGRSLIYDIENIVTSDKMMFSSPYGEPKGTQLQFDYKTIKNNTKDYKIKIWLPSNALKLNTNLELKTKLNKQKEHNIYVPTWGTKQIFFIPYISKFNLKWINFKEKNVFTKNKIGFFFLKGNTFFNTSNKLIYNKTFLNSKIYNLCSKINFVFDKVDIIQDTRYLDLQICLELQKLHLNNNFLKLRPLLDKLIFKNFTYNKNQIYYFGPRQNKEYFFYKKQFYYTIYNSEKMSFSNTNTGNRTNNIDQWNVITLQINKSLLFLPNQKVFFYLFKPITTTTSIYVHQEIFVCNYRKEIYLAKQKINQQFKIFGTTNCELKQIISKTKNLSSFFSNLLKIVINRQKNYCISIDTTSNIQFKMLNNWQNILFSFVPLWGQDKKQNKIVESVQVLKKSGQLIHMNKQKITLRLGQPLVISPRSIIHASHGDFIRYKTSVITLTYQQLKTGDIVQGIPKVEQLFEARTTKRGRLFRDNVTNLLTGLFLKYFVKSAYLLRKNMLDISKKTNITYSQNLQTKKILLKQRSSPMGTPNLFVNNKQNQTIILALALHWSVKQSFYKIQQIIVDGILRVYRSQGVSIADKHVEIIVKQMTSKVRIINSNAAKLTDYSFSLQNINRGLDLESNKQMLSFKQTAQTTKTKQTILRKRKSSNTIRKYQKRNQIFETKLLEQLLSNNLDGPSGLFPGEIVDIDFVENINIFLFKTSSFDTFNAKNQTTFAIEPIKYEPIVLGITRASLEVESFLSAASFQQTTRVLSQAALYKKKDFLKGLKENIIIGNLIPAGTGYLSSLNLTFTL